ncbi:MAG TPA: amidohydrolase [Porticoccaceae bacterium]|jgi:imidazolonepropionase-like amidohydrolase|nr:amidohydrolase [Gammaproteobacteria bacterium]HIL61026.1 amidohydrolase [Porticoccaceae bacterium]
MKRIDTPVDPSVKFKFARFVPTAFAALLALLMAAIANAQQNQTPNGIADDRAGAYALTNANIYQPDGSVLRASTLLIREGKIVQVDESRNVPNGYFEIDLDGKYIYPGFIDIYTEYGIPSLERESGGGGVENLFPSDQAFNVNDAIKSNFRASTTFVPDEELRKKYRRLGFSSVLSLRADGIARGTSALITLGDMNANESIIIPDVAAHYSLNKGTSTQQVPSSLMGAFALLRQTNLDARWFDVQSPRPFTDDSLEAWNANQELPQIMEVSNWQQALTVDRVGDEFETQYVLKMSGDAYKQAELIRRTNATLIVPLNFPEAPKVEDVLEAEEVGFSDLKHWELAPFNPKILNEHEINFAFTSSEANQDFWENIRTAVRNGLPEQQAIAAITSIPAEILGAADLVGQLSVGALANFVISSDALFAKDARLLENWVRGERFVLDDDRDDRNGIYSLNISSVNSSTNRADQQFEVELSFAGNKAAAKILLEGDESREVNLELTDDLVSFNFVFDESGNRARLVGWPDTGGWSGNGRAPDGSRLSWQLRQSGDLTVNANEQSNESVASGLPAPVIYPFSPYGRESAPEQTDVLIQGATVWTNEAEGTLVTDVLVRAGKIAAVGDNLPSDGATLVDGTGKHLTPGIIDEHSHIALFSINETATNSSMVRMKDVVNSENINIYRNLAGGVVAAQLLHGSANPIGGQSAIIKMRWGAPPQELLIDGADEYIKFALGENVKRSRNPASIRYPQTRMGVEQVFVNAFSQALEYGKAWDNYNSLSRSQQRSTIPPRRDLVDETMLEILNSERFVTSHSYVQSEINMLLNVADSFDFNINTFTHILEGYKVADKMALHGAGGSTFSDWFGYKWEVRYAIPYNAALMQQAGVVVAINSDDAEMSRRLNQEAAKAIKYGDMSEIDALKLVTLNPARLLHLDDRMGSILEGKDADIVLWSDHPLSVYAVVETTWVDGIPYYDREEDRVLRQQIADERARIIAVITNNNSSDNQSTAN